MATVADERKLQGRPTGAALQRRNTAYAFGAQASTALFTALLTLVLLRLLGTRGYGEFAVAVAVGSLVLLPADFGVSGSTARFLAEARRSRTTTHRVIVAGFRLKLLASGAVSVALMVLATPIASAYHDMNLVWPLRAMALVVLAQGVMRFCLGCFSARQRNGLSLAVVTAESFAETLASIVLVLAGGGAAGATFGRAAGYAVGAALGIVVLALLFRLSPRALLRRAEPGASAPIARYAGALALVDGVWSAFNQVDILLIGAILTAADAGIFQAPLRLLALASYPGIALGAAVGPRLARTGPEEAVDPRPLLDAARALVVGQAFVAAFIVAWSVPLTRVVFGGGYAESATVFAALAPYVLLSGLAPLLSSAIDYVGGTRRRIRVGVAALVVNVVLDVVLLRQIGVVGAAIGTDVGYVIYVLGHIGVGAQLLRFRVGALVASFGRSALAGAAMTAVLLVGTRLGAPGAALAVLLGPAAFAAVLVVSGEARAQPWLGRRSSAVLGLLRRRHAEARGEAAIS